MLILIIEDEGALRENLKELLEMHEYRCVVAADGMEGIEMAKTVNPDLVLCDITLPFFDGYEVKIELSKMKMNLPFIFLTARTDKEDYARALALGAVDFITKPFKIEHLLNRIAWNLKNN